MKLAKLKIAGVSLLAASALALIPAAPEKTVKLSSETAQPQTQATVEATSQQPVEQAQAVNTPTPATAPATSQADVHVITSSPTPAAAAPTPPAAPQRRELDAKVTYSETPGDPTREDATCHYTFDDGSTVDRYAGSRPKPGVQKFTAEIGCAAWRE